MRHYIESYKRSKMRSGSWRLQIMLRQSHLPLAVYGSLIPLSVCSSSIREPLHSMLSWHIWHRPLIFHRSQFRHEHVSVPFIILANMDLSVWLAGKGTVDTTAYSESAAPNAAARTMMRTTNRHGPADSQGGRIYGPLCPSLSQNAFSLAGSFSLSLLYWSHSSQVHDFHDPGVPPDRTEI